MIIISETEIFKKKYRFHEIHKSEIKKQLSY